MGPTPWRHLIGLRGSSSGGDHRPVLDRRSTSRCARCSPPLSTCMVPLLARGMSGGTAPAQDGGRGRSGLDLLDGDREDSAPSPHNQAVAAVARSPQRRPRPSLCRAGAPSCPPRYRKSPTSPSGNRDVTARTTHNHLSRANRRGPTLRGVTGHPLRGHAYARAASLGERGAPHDETPSSRATDACGGAISSWGLRVCERTRGRPVTPLTRVCRCRQAASSPAGSSLGRPDGRDSAPAAPSGSGGAAFRSTGGCATETTEL